MFRIVPLFITVVASLFVTGTTWAEEDSEAPPQFSLAWSEYPSWSVFGVADQNMLINGEKMRLLNGKAGRQGLLEEFYGVDIVLQQKDYDTCIMLYGSNNADAVCITNQDIMASAQDTPSVMILPTSTSKGADAVIVTDDIQSVSDLRGVPIRGLEKSVAQYNVIRNLQKEGKDPNDYSFVNMDPAAAATAMQQGDSNIRAIAVWNPFLLETLNRRDDVHVLFDSTTIPDEIIDCVVMTQSALDREGGHNAAKCIIAAFYVMNMAMQTTSKDDITIAIGEKFSNLDLQSMRQVLRQTVFYRTPDDGLELMNSVGLRATMDTVAAYSSEYGIIESPVSIGFGTAAEAPNADFRIDPSFIESYKKNSWSFSNSTRR